MCAVCTVFSIILLMVQSCAREEVDRRERHLVCNPSHVCLHFRYKPKCTCGKRMVREWVHESKLPDNFTQVLGFIAGTMCVIFRGETLLPAVSAAAYYSR